jgi:integrase/recombinase XerC
MSVARFLQYIKFEKRFSPHTVLAYENDLDQFFSYQQTTFEVSDVPEINHTMIRSWIVSMMEAKMSSRSVNRKITTLKTFYKFLLRSGTVTINPMLKIQSPKTSKRLPVFVDQSKMDLLFEQVNFGEGYEAGRDKLMLELFYATGMRLTELVNLKETDIDLANCQIKVLGKRNKERIIPFTNTFRNVIAEYLEKKKDYFSLPINHLFVTVKGKPIYNKLVYRIVTRRLGEVTTLDKKSPHVLRHTFATHMLNHGADINSIKEILGHANLSATQVYTHNTIDKLKKVHKQAHPRA